MDETRIERALREGPPFRTHYVERRPPISSGGRHRAPLAFRPTLFRGS